ncbi:MAG: hypothetical protein RR626_02420, partial [Anaerovoracaceae bacterium]
MLEEKLRVDSTVEQIIVALTAAVILLGYYPIGQLELKWDNLDITFYRIAIVVLFLYFVVRRIVLKIEKKYYSKIFFFFVFTMVLWFFWGKFFLYKNDYVDLILGQNQIFTVLMGLLSVYCIYESCHTKEGLSIIFWTTRIVVVGLTAFAVVEMSTDFHLMVSKLSDPAYLELINSTLEENFMAKMISYNASAIFYNVNDFSAFLVIFSPLFYPQKKYKRWVNGIFIGELILQVLIFSKNDAWICTLSMLIGGIAYLILSKAKWKTWLI